MLRTRFALFIAFAMAALSFHGVVIAQQGVIVGQVIDSLTRTSIPGAHVTINDLPVTATDRQGYFEWTMPEGSHHIWVSYVGFETAHLQVEIRRNDTTRIRIMLQPGVELETAVVSASRYEQRISDVSVSMEVMKATYIENINTRQLDQSLAVLPGVDVLDGQANIRNGSGYSYGAGSRVMMLIDGMPILTGDVNDVKWSFIPVENISQVEVVKGASSALYGSSALNGVINIRTALPGPEPVTRIETFAGAYMHPKRKQMSHWWKRLPFYGGIRAMHLQQIGTTDVSAGISASGDEGYRDEDYLHFGRLNLSIRHRLKDNDRISFGVRTSVQWQKSSDFLIWQDADSGAFLQQGDAITPTVGVRYHIDPYFQAYDKDGGRHLLQSRVYRVSNHFRDDPDKENASLNFFGEYQYSRSFDFGMTVTGGMSGSHTRGRSNLYGDHEGNSVALFAQVDQRVLKRILLNLGFRWERYSIDRDESGSRPVVRAGINYALFEHTRFRASFGQGYRYPSMTEKFTSTSLSGVNIFPNPNLQAETGWSAEVGLQQGFRVGGWSGFADVVAFRTEYDEMIEFNFGVHVPDSITVPGIEHLGFKPLNLGKARIQGIEIGLNTSGNAGPVNITAFAGYTYTDPADLSNDTIMGQILKYRYRHSFKADAQADYSSFSMGFSVVYRSFMERIDWAFEEEILGQEFFPGLKEYRQKNNTGHVVVDLRIIWQATPSSQFNFSVFNLFNQEYMGRPGDIGPPLNMNLKYTLLIH